MFALLVVSFATGSVPTPSQAILASSHPSDWTRQLLAQAAEQDEEIEALERDMDRSRQRLGHPTEAEAAPTATPAPAPESRRVAPDPSYRPTYEGHTRGYFLTWGIVDWVLAGQLWAVAAYTGFVALIVATIVGGANDAGLVALVYGGIAVGSAGLGGLAAWRAVNNIRIYRDLKSEEQYHRAAQRPGPRR